MRKYHFLSLLLVVISLALMGWFFSYLVEVEKNKIQDELKIEATKVERILAYNFNHTAEVLGNINAQIKKDPYNKKYINEIIKKYKINANQNDEFSWTVFSWANSDHQIIVDSIYDIMKEPFDLSIRDYVHYAKAEPGKFFIGQPGIGSTSKKWMIPGGIGLLDKNEKFAGTVTIGFEISVLAKIVQDSMQSKTVKIIIFDTKNETPILSVNFNSIESFNNDGASKISNLDQMQQMLKHLKESDLEKISNIDVFLHQGYLVEKVENYPLAIVLEYDKHAIADEMWLVVYSRLCEIIFIIIIGAILLWMIDKIKGEKVSAYMARRKIDKINRITNELFSSLTNLIKNQILQINNVTKQLKSSFKESDLEMKQELYLKELKELSQNSLEVLDDLIDINWAGNKNFLVDMQNKININDIIKRIININNPTALKKKITIEFDYQKVAPMINLDPKGMKQIFMNLISNSVKHSLSNSVIKIKAEKNHDQLVVSIKDTGYGIKPETVKKILNQKTDYRDFQSSTDFGVGLSLVKRLVELQNGKMEIISKANKGTEIILFFNY